MAHQILVVDNEQFQGTLVSTVLKDHGYAVHFAQTVDEAIEVAKSRTFDLLLTDLRLPPGRAFSELETKGGHETGIALARAIRELIPQIAIIVYTAGPSEGLRAQFGEHPYIKIFDKPALPEKIVLIVGETLSHETARPKMFIVHGRDRELLLGLKDFLQNTLRMGEPIILADQPSIGRTLVEKFELYADKSDLVFVLLTPDDVGRLRGDGDNEYRPRLNVIFELGYFFGSLRRVGGRILVLRKGHVEIPSDIAGIVYVDISAGILAASEELRRELKQWL